MIGWTAVIPFKGRAARKTRLAGIFSEEQRDRLSQAMFDRTCAVLAGCDAVGEIAVLSDIRPPAWRGRLISDAGRGLNAELNSVAGDLVTQCLLVIHADLPLLEPQDIGELLEAAGRASMAIAPDHLGTGTNAIALVDPAGFAFHFGPHSRTKHVEAGQDNAAIVDRMGLSLDIDTPEDYDRACRHAPQIRRWIAV